MFSKIHHFLNSHWEFSFILTWFIYWVAYRQGYKYGRSEAISKGETDGDSK